jgi:hypothetical protein
MHAIAHIVAIVGAALVQHDELLGVLHRQQPQHQLIHQGEDGGVGADPQCQGKNRHGGEERTPADRAQGKSQVPDEAGHNTYTTERVSG